MNEVFKKNIPTDFRQRTVLIVDDNPKNLEVIVNCMEEKGFNASVATSGEIALKRAKHLHPDIILLDVMMSGIDGFETCRRLKSDKTTSDIPVIFMTALTEAENKVKAFSAGAVDYVTKPVQKEEILARVTTHLAIHRYQEDLEKEIQKRTAELEERMVMLENEIVERKQAEENLEKSRKYYQALFNKNRDGYVIAKGSGELLDPNPAFAKMLGYSVQETKKLSFWKLTPKKWIEWEANIHGKKLIEQGYTDLYEKEYIQRDGTVFPIEVQAFLLNEAKDLDSALIGAFVRDITKRKRAETELNLSNTRYQNLFQNAPVPLWEEDFTEVFKYLKEKNVQNFRKSVDANPSLLNKCSRKVKILDVNQEALKLHNAKTKKELLGNLDKIFTEKSFETFKEEIISLFEGSLEFESEGEVKTLSGEKRSIFLKMTIEKERHDAYRALIATIDITDRNQMEERLKQAQKMESIGSLAGGIAHDFNNLLFPILGMSEMLLEDLPEDSLEYENAKEIFHAAKRAGDLVKQILAFSRQSEHKMTPIRMQSVLKEALKLCRSTIPANIVIHEDIQQNCGLVMADPTQVHQVAMNLITNAFHAIEEKNGTIDTDLTEIDLQGDEIPDSALQPGQYVRLSVSDNGIGMSQSTIHKIFEPYFTTKKKGKGTGLGLAVVYGIVKEHGGGIKVSSKVGKGTTFNVYLPLMKKSSDKIIVDKVTEPAIGTENILLVDDEVSVAKLEGQMLSRLGYHVTVKINSNDALNMFKANPDSYDLVISDMTMPEMTGDQLVKKILSIRPEAPIIICTGFSERINKEQAEVLGVKGFLMKPVVKSDMAQMVRRVLDEDKNS